MFYPSIDQYPNCFVRLKDETLLRDDTIPKETILLEFHRAQDFIVKEAITAGCRNTGITASNSRKATYVAPSSHVFPFASKALHAVLSAATEGKPPPTLEECRPPSLVLPADSDEWSDVENTFSCGKLLPEVARKQFQEKLPHLPESLLKREAAAKERLASVLSFQSTLEILMGRYKDSEVFKVLSKTHMSTLYTALSDFVTTRRECRAYVLRFAKVRHEPQRLIDSNIWGRHLFPDAIVKDVMSKAANENKNLLDKWDARYFQSKRKFTPGQGPQPKGKRSRRDPSQRPFKGSGPSRPSASSASSSRAPAYPSKVNKQNRAAKYGLPDYDSRRSDNRRDSGTRKEDKRGKGPFRGSRGARRGRGRGSQN